jgi:predicted unusual protein kinase regulating ubiquinone biosynthesis (AarF/ABC1/UbiB family)
MWVALVTVGGLATLALLAFLVLGRGSLPSGRAGRLARIGRLWAGLSASWLGAKFRRVFASKASRERIDEARRQADAKRITETMGQMKGAFMKLGQLMSFMSDSLPVEMRTALASLQAEAPPMDFPQIRDVVESELGKSLERAFARFDEQPLASASVGQVHRAKLASGEEVVVKVQYPGVADAIRSDMANVAVLHRVIALGYPALDPKPVSEELRARITEELDYANEAKNQRHFVSLYGNHPFIRVPRVIDAYSTSKILTSEFVKGKRWNDVLAGDDEAMKNRYGEILFRFVMGSIVRHGAFNGDPHPGNYLFDEQGRVVFLDYGCVKFFPQKMLANWTELIRRHLRNDHEGFRELTLELGFIPRDSELPSDLIFDYFGYYYEPWAADAPFRFTTEYQNRSFKMVFAPDGKFAGMSKKMNMPPDFVFVNRIHWGVFAILAKLGATGNWHRIQREYLYGDAGSTELGQLDDAFRARRAA